MIIGIIVEAVESRTLPHTTANEPVWISNKVRVGLWGASRKDAKWGQELFFDPHATNRRGLTPSPAGPRGTAARVGTFITS